MKASDVKLPQLELRPVAPPFVSPQTLPPSLPPTLQYWGGDGGVITTAGYIFRRTQIFSTERHCGYCLKFHFALCQFLFLHLLISARELGASMANASCLFSQKRPQSLHWRNTTYVICKTTPACPYTVGSHLRNAHFYSRSLSVIHSHCYRNHFENHFHFRKIHTSSGVGSEVLITRINLVNYTGCCSYSRP